MSQASPSMGAQESRVQSLRFPRVLISIGVCMAGAAVLQGCCGDDDRPDKSGKSGNSDKPDKVKSTNFKFDTHEKLTDESYVRVAQAEVSKHGVKAMLKCADDKVVFVDGKKEFNKKISCTEKVVREEIKEGTEIGIKEGTEVPDEPVYFEFDTDKKLTDKSYVKVKENKVAKDGEKAMLKCANDKVVFADGNKKFKKDISCKEDMVNKEIEEGTDIGANGSFFLQKEETRDVHQHAHRRMKWNRHGHVHTDHASEKHSSYVVEADGVAEPSP